MSLPQHAVVTLSDGRRVPIRYVRRIYGENEKTTFTWIHLDLHGDGAWQELGSDPWPQRYPSREEIRTEIERRFPPTPST
jgi:hypothetical protein